VGAVLAGCAAGWFTACGGAVLAGAAAGWFSADTGAGGAGAGSAEDGLAACCDAPPPAPARLALLAGVVGAGSVGDRLVTTNVVTAAVARTSRIPMVANCQGLSAFFAMAAPPSWVPTGDS
jgi:hypothetical protein